MRFSTPMAAELTEASERQVRYWHKTGLLRASGKATGHRLYTFSDIVALKTVKALRDQGCSLQKIRAAVRYLRKNYPEDTEGSVLARLTLLTDGRQVYLLSNVNEIMEVVTGQTVLWVVAVGRLIQETNAQTKSLAWEWVETVKVRGHTYHLVLSHEPDDTGYSVQCRELPGAIEQGETVEETISNGKAAVESVLAFMKKRGTQRRERIAHSG